ncbi:hypothetical protein DFO73_101183 [Cytobacillus oceanisediminis]|uniref:Uncharacterized protein n=1 Tax=Cytobacillus oceanisediminis TaxID=665099 RepID=A0A2V3ADL4_9BACI|nr:hypothetical protein DFO73_101183 [Cytobacillus oceanisediminis]
MCLCHEINKRFSPKDLYHGRTLQPAKVKRLNYAPAQVKTKKTPQSFSKYLK